MQLSFGDQPGPKKLVVLCLEFLFSCAMAAVVTSMLESDSCKWKKAAITAVGFFPAPIFGGKLMTYLSQFMSLSVVSRGLINLAACIFAAILASFVPTKLAPPFTQFGPIVRESMGFGLGIAWNLFLQSIFAPDEMDASHMIGLAGYLALVALITFRVAAQVEASYDEPIMVERLWILLTFAMQTVTAFTLVAFVDALTADGWTGNFENLFILLLFAALISTFVARIDINALDEHDSNEDENCGLDHLPCVLKLLVFVPCLWLCCPWLPAIFLLSGVQGVGLRERWFQVSNMIGGLAASIEASGMLTKLADDIAAGIEFCTEEKCHNPWMFVLLQACVALVATSVMIPLLVNVVPDFLLPPESSDEFEDYFEDLPKHKKPIEYVTATQSDAVSLLSGPSSKYSSI